MVVDLIAGARPNFMKIAPIIRAMDKSAIPGLLWRLVHTRQHYDRNMSDSFFEELGIPQPQVNLGAGGGTHAGQTARIKLGYEELPQASPCDLCLVVGDVTSTMACAIVAKKANIQVAHVVGGIRSGDLSIPEEVNSLVTDSITDYFFTISEVANANLRKAGVGEERLFFVGNTMIDTLLANTLRFVRSIIWETAELHQGEYLVITLHRPANVNDPENLERLLREIIRSADRLKMVFPVHPRTRQALDQIALEEKNLILTDPLPYLSFNYLVQQARAVITDSGGITEETTVLGIPCMTLRTNTERPETVTIDTNELLGTDPGAIVPAMAHLLSGQWKKGQIPPLWDGHTAERIVKILGELSRNRT